MDYSKLKKLITQKGTTIEILCSQIGMSAGGFHYSVKNETFKIKDLEKVAEVLGVPVSYFFEAGENKTLVSSIKITSLEMALNEIEHLKQRLLDKETEIKLKDEIIDLLKKK